MVLLVCGGWSNIKYDNILLMFNTLLGLDGWMGGDEGIPKIICKHSSYLAKSYPSVVIFGFYYLISLK